MAEEKVKDTIIKDASLNDEDFCLDIVFRENTQIRVINGVCPRIKVWNVSLEDLQQVKKLIQKIEKVSTKKGENE